MKYVLTVLISYSVIAGYFILLNGGPQGWIPVALIIGMLSYYFMDIRIALCATLTAGCATDMHYLYIGPTIIAGVAALVVIHALRSIIAPQQRILSALVLTGISTTVYLSLLLLLTALVNGFRFYYAGAYSLIAVVGMVCGAWAILFLTIMTVRMSLRLYQYARR